MKKDAYYFPHDSNAKDDPKIVVLIEQLGLEGYGIYWVLIEHLRDQPEYRYPLAAVPGIARKYLTTSEKVKTVISAYGLFQFDDQDFFFSPSLLNRMKDIDLRRQKLIKAGRKGGLSRAKALLKQPSSSKEKEIIEKDSKGLIPPSEWKDFLKGQEDLLMQLSRLGVDANKSIDEFVSERQLSGAKNPSDLKQHCYNFINQKKQSNKVLPKNIGRFIS